VLGILATCRRGRYIKLELKIDRSRVWWRRQEYFPVLRKVKVPPLQRNMKYLFSKEFKITQLHLMIPVPRTFYRNEETGFLVDCKLDKASNTLGKKDVDFLNMAMC
jgi:hypothetical protein